MNEAAQAYQLAKMDSDAKAAHMRCAEYRLKENDHQSAARSYDQAGEFEKAADCYMICGGIDQAVRSIMRRGNTTGGDPALQIKCFERAIDLYSKDEGKDILASDVYKQYITRLLIMCDWERYYSVSSDYILVLSRLEQWSFVYKEILSQVIIRLSRNELVGAERVLAKNLNVHSGFVHSPEYDAADDMINAIKENDGEALKKVVAKPTVLYVNTEVVKIAKSIKTVIIVPTNSATDTADVDSMLM